MNVIAFEINNEILPEDGKIIMFMSGKTSCNQPREYLRIGKVKHIKKDNRVDYYLEEIETNKKYWPYTVDLIFPNTKIYGVSSELEIHKK